MSDNAMQRAVWRFGRDRFRNLARKVVWHIQRIEASGIFGADFRHKTLWDEYCHEVQQGPHDGLESAWEMTIRPFIERTVGGLSSGEKMVLFFARDEAAEYEEDEPVVDDDAITSEIMDGLAQLAGARNLDKFDPTLND